MGREGQGIEWSVDRAIRVAGVVTVAYVLTVAMEVSILPRSHSLPLRLATFPLWHASCPKCYGEWRDLLHCTY